MAGRIDSIYCFNYALDIGFYESVRDFASLEMTYIGMAVSTPRVRIDASPTKFRINEFGSNQVREYAISRMNELIEISKNLAENSPRYILIKYFDGSEKFYKYDEAFCRLFNIALLFKPVDTSPPPIPNNPYVIQQTSNPYMAQKNNSDSIMYTKSQQAPIRSSVPIATPQPKKQTKTESPARWIAVLLLIFVGLIISLISSSKDDPVEITPTTNVSTQSTIPKPKLTPVTEPISGTILFGEKVNDGSEITVTASSIESCVVKLKSSSGTTLLSFYVRAGDTVTVNVPAKFMYVYFASGKTWYGSKHLFGENTGYSKDDDLLDFTQYTWEYTLYPVTNGNFSETPIDASEF